jgi:hypothetical protein
VINQVLDLSGLIVLRKYHATVTCSNAPPLLLPFSIMGLEDEDQRTELTQEERERRVKAPLLCCLVAQERLRSEADARTRRLRQEMRQDLDAYNMRSLQTESEALDLGTEVPLHRSAVSVHQRMSSSLYIEDKTALPPPMQGVILEARSPPAERRSALTPWPRPVRDHLDSLIVLPKTTSTSAPPLSLMLNPVQSHLNSLVNVEAGVQLPPFCLVTQDLPSMTLNLPKVGAGSAGPVSTLKPSAQSGTKPLPIPAGRLRERRLRKIKEGVLRHNQECREVQDRLNIERQRLHWVAVRYGLSTNLWTAIILMIPFILHEVGPVKGFQVYDCSLSVEDTDDRPHGAKELQGPGHGLSPSKGDRDQDHPDRWGHTCTGHTVHCPKTQEVTRCGGLPSFHYGSFKVAIDQPVEVTPTGVQGRPPRRQDHYTRSEDGLQGRREQVSSILLRWRKNPSRGLCHHHVHEEQCDLPEIL